MNLSYCSELELELELLELLEELKSDPVVVIGSELELELELGAVDEGRDDDELLLEHAAAAWNCCSNSDLS